MYRPGFCKTVDSLGTIFSLIGHSDHVRFGMESDEELAQKVSQCLETELRSSFLHWKYEVRESETIYLFS